MIVDIHTHLIGFDELTQKLKDDIVRCGMVLEKFNYTEEDYIKGTTGADAVIVFGIRGKATGWCSDNEKVAEFVNINKKKYIFFTSVDPTEEDFMDQLEFSHKNLGCKGLKIGPVYQGVHPHDPRYYQIFDYCQKHGLPVITHMAAVFTSGTYLEYAQPILMDKIACDFPGLNIVLAHLGHPWGDETIAIIRKQPNLYADNSALYYRPWQFYNTMRLLEEYKAAGKVFFGSDYPACTTEESIEGLKNVNKIIGGSGLPKISEALIDEILYKNPLPILGIG